LYISSFLTRFNSFY